MAHKLWVPEDATEFRELAIVQGWTKNALAEHYGVKRDAIRRAMVKLGFTKDADATWPGTSYRPPGTPRAALRADTQGLSEFKDAMLADIAADTKLRSRIRHKVARVPSAEQHAREVDLMDVHIGKYGWGLETGTDYDSAIAERCVRDAVGDLLEQARHYRCDETILPVGNDLLHTDNYAGTTTMGTPQDRDTRFQLMFRRARSLMSAMISLCAEDTNVRVVIIPGNHDALSAWTLGEVLAAEYANDPRVTFDGSPKKRKYVLYGKNLIGYAHGHAEPHKKLPEIMAAEVPDLWAAATFREWHLGHLHKSKVTQPIYVDDHAGCTVRVLRSLSGTDSWHAQQGYVGGVRGAEAFIWKKSGGMRANLFHSVSEAA